MKKIMIVLMVAMMGLIIMSSALKPREEENTQIQTVINKEMNVAVVSEGNDNQQVVNQSKEKTVLELKDILPEKYKEIKLVEMKWGTGKNELGYLPGTGACGPMGIALDTLLNLYILDARNGAVKKYNDNGELIEIYINEDIEFHNISNMEISEDGKYIYGIYDERMGKYIYKYNMEKYSGEHIEKGLENEYKIIHHGVEIYQNEKLVKKYGGSEELMDKNRTEDKMKDIINTKDRNVFRTNKLNMAKTYNDNYQVYNSLRCYYIGKDRNNNYYIATYYTKKSQYFDEPPSSKTVVYKYKETGEILSVIILDEEEIDYLNYHFEKHLRVNRDGDVYYFCPKEDGAVMYKYESIK